MQQIVSKAHLDKMCQWFICVYIMPRNVVHSLFLFLSFVYLCISRVSSICLYPSISISVFLSSLFL